MIALSAQAQYKTKLNGKPMVFGNQLNPYSVWKILTKRNAGAILHILFLFWEKCMPQNYVYT